MIPEKVIEDFRNEVIDFDTELEALEQDLGNVYRAGLKKSANEIRDRIKSKVEMEFDNLETDRGDVSLSEWHAIGGKNTYTVFTNAPHARAHEYGSGIYAGKGEYTISSNGDYPLEFYWENYSGKEYVKSQTDIKLVNSADVAKLSQEQPIQLDSVSHPGVEPKFFVQNVWNKYVIGQNKPVSNIGDELQDSIERNLDG